MTKEQALWVATNKALLDVLSRAYPAIDKRRLERLVGDASCLLRASILWEENMSISGAIGGEFEVHFGASDTRIPFLLADRKQGAE